MAMTERTNPVVPERSAVPGQRAAVVGVFENRSDAQQAVQELKGAGFRDDQIGIATRDEERPETAGERAEGSHVGQGAVAGAAAGAGVGALWGLGIIAGFLPAIGPAIAGGILATILTSAAAGAAVAGLAGALIGLGIPEEEARYYEGEFKSGRSIVTVKADGRYEEAEAILRRHGAYDINRPRETAAAERAGADRTMELREEELRVHREPVEAGEVRVRKEVHTEHRTVEVPVRKEEVVVERHPVAERTTTGEIREGEEVRVPVSEEEVRVEKQPVVTEEVTIGKRAVKGTERVGGTVRKEEVRVEKEGDVDIKQK